MYIEYTKEYAKFYLPARCQVSNANFSARKLWSNASKMTRNSIPVNSIIEEGLKKFCNNTCTVEKS